MSHNSAASIAWAKRNPDKVRETKRRFRERHKERIKAERAAASAANREKRNEAVRQWVAANPEMAAAQRLRARLRKMQRKTENSLKFNYNVTADQYARLSESQDNLCAICRKPNDTARTKRLFVDHNHTTGRLRALLCHSCNAGLGYFKEDPALFLRAVAYLKAFEGEPEHPEWDQDAVLGLGRAGWEDWL